MRGLKRSSAADVTVERRLKYLIDRACATLETMPVYGVKPDIVAYNTLLDACRHAGDIERAFGYWEELERAGLEPTAISYGTIMSLCGDVGEHLLGLRYYAEFKGRAPERGTKELYTCAIHMCSKEGDYDFAYATYQDMLEARVKPDGLVYAALMDVAARSAAGAEKAFEL